MESFKGVNNSGKGKGRESMESRSVSRAIANGMKSTALLLLAAAAVTGCADYIPGLGAGTNNNNRPGIRLRVTPSREQRRAWTFKNQCGDYLKGFDPKKVDLGGVDGIKGKCDDAYESAAGQCNDSREDCQSQGRDNCGVSGDQKSAQVTIRTELGKDGQSRELGTDCSMNCDTGEFKCD